MIKNSKIKKIADSKIFWAIIALLASLLVWMYVTTTEGVEIEVPFSGVKVVFSGEEALRESKGLIVTSADTSSVTVTLSGKRRVISSLSSSSIVAVIDLSLVSNINTTTENMWSYTLEYPKGVDPSDITVVSMTPDVINFTVDKLSSKPVEVRGEFSGSVAEGFAVEPMEFSPATIRISGPQAEINKVAYAYVEIVRDDVNMTVSIDQMSYDLRNYLGESVVSDYITVDTDTVMVTLPVIATKEVQLTVDLVAGAGATADNAVITCTPSKITLSGDSEILEGINKLVLGTVDLSDIETAHTETFQIFIPNDTENMTGISEATVTVELKGFATKKFIITNIEYINLKEGYDAEIVNAAIEVVIRAPEDIIESITSNNIRAVADLSGMVTTGYASAPAKVYVDGFSGAGAIGDHKIYVYLSES